MCGILGYSTLNPQEKNLHALKTGIHELQHRGPDNTGIWISDNGCLGMAHSRLSIIDLSNNANQPMQDQDEGLIVGFNGEIYNFIELREQLKNLGCIFTTDSDTEVILQGYKTWKNNLFQKLRGMFAISIYDILQDQIVLARDHSGQKPLFYSYNKEDHSFIFASELKGLFNFESFSKNISRLGLNHLFSLGYCEDSLCIYKNVNKLSAGSYLSLNLKKNKLKIKEFWSVENFINNRAEKTLSENQLINKLETILLESIELQFRSDVPVGMLLSGGVDSSLIVALASKVKDSLDTYTVRFSGHKIFDESSHARLIANHFKTNHFELEASKVQPHIFEEVIKFYDEPIFDTSIIPTYMLSKMISKYCKVAIGGDGGDELFGGYPHYDKLLRIKRNSRFLPYFIRNAASNIVKSILPIGIRGAKTIEFYGVNLSNMYPNTAEFFSTKEQQKLFNKDFIKFFDSIDQDKIDTKIFKSLIDTATFQDFNYYLREDILVKVDRASMANSLEIRSPFLDHKLIEFAFHEIPPEYKATDKNRKILLKKLAKRHLPSSFDYDRKQGFSLPLKDLIISESWIEYIHSKIQSSDPSIFNHEYAFNLLNKQKNYFNNAERLAGLLFFMIWFEEFNPSYDLAN